MIELPPRDDLIPVEVSEGSFFRLCPVVMSCNVLHLAVTYGSASVMFQPPFTRLSCFICASSVTRYCSGGMAA